MEQKQVDLNEIYKIIKKMQSELIEIKERLNKQHLDIDDWVDIKFLADEKSLSGGWLSKEDEEAFAYLQ